MSRAVAVLHLSGDLSHCLGRVRVQSSSNCVCYNSIISDLRAYFCSENDKFKDFRARFPNNRKQQISLKEAAEFRVESSRFSRCLVKTMFKSVVPYLATLLNR